MRRLLLCFFWLACPGDARRFQPGARDSKTTQGVVIDRVPYPHGQKLRQDVDSALVDDGIQRKANISLDVEEIVKQSTTSNAALAVLFLAHHPHLTAPRVRGRTIGSTVGHTPSQHAPFLLNFLPVIAAAVNSMIIAAPAHALDYSTTNMLASVDPVDYYYGFFLLVGSAIFIKNSIQTTVQEAKEYDERGPLANAMLAANRKRDLEERKQKIRDMEPRTQARLQAEKDWREGKRGKWQNFDSKEDESLLRKLDGLRGD